MEGYPGHVSRPYRLYLNRDVHTARDPTLDTKKLISLGLQHALLNAGGGMVAGERATFFVYLAKRSTIVH